MLNQEQLEALGYTFLEMPDQNFPSFTFYNNKYCELISPSKMRSGIIKLEDAIKIANQDLANNKFYYYQNASRDTYKEVVVNGDLSYLILGMIGEVGEFTNKIKKIYRDKDGDYSLNDIEDLTYELGDILWYLTNICTNLGISLDNVAIKNVEKLADRKKRGVIGGSGDNR